MIQQQKTTQRLQARKPKWRKEQIFAMVVACIPLLGFIIFNGFPLIISFIGMFCNVDLYDLTNIQWNNFEGFKSVFIPRHAYDLFYFDLAKYFYKAVIITVWIASTQLVTLLVALFVATLLHEKPNGAKLFQILFFIPYICSTVAVSLMWRWILDWEGGILNSLLGTDIRWLEDPKTITWCIIIAIIWQAPGYGIVMYKAAFSNVNQSLYEAAALDGAGEWNQFVHITLPSIAPTTFYLIIVRMIAVFKIFSSVNVFTMGSSIASNTSIVQEIYSSAFCSYTHGYASAQSVVLLVIILIITAINFWGQKKWVHY
jgi:multiple sugar transport system permease protein